MSATADFTKPNNTMSLKPMQQPVGGSTVTRNSGGTADTLPMERKKASFEVEKLINFLDGGAENTTRKRFIMSPTEGMDVSDKFNMDRHDLYKAHVGHFIEVHKKFWSSFRPTRDDLAWMSEYSMFSGAMTNHYAFFLTTVAAQGTDEQQGWWMEKIMKLQMVGCYAQTELGHGSNVRGLSTTAIYDAKKQEFVINTPTLPSIKWWPGGLGKVATHAVVFAQLFLDGKEYGLHVFVVQIRDENHRPLPGVEVGDIGNKLGDNANDAGFLRLENVRIPREHMLAKYQEVTAEGKYVKSKLKTNDKVHYATMVFTRGSMVRIAGGYLARAVTIATRYSLVRKQGFLDPSDNSASYKSEERQILDYQVQRYRVLKQLALAYNLKFCGKWMTDRFKDLVGTSEGGVGAGGLSNLAALPEIAATSAGLKALATLMCAEGIEDCRKCCGGNGYLLNSGVAALAADYVMQVTAEGDVILLQLLTARFLLKSLQNARAGKEVAGPASYLAPLKNSNYDIKAARPKEPKTLEDLLSFDYLLGLFRYRALLAVVGAGEEMQNRVMNDGLSPVEAWNATSLQLVDANKAHSTAFMLSNNVSIIRAAEKDGKADGTIIAALSRLARLFALSNLLEDGQWGVLGLMTANIGKLARTGVWQLLEELRPDALALVDAFDIPDRVLNSTIGRYDGNVYEALMDAAMKSTLNAKDPFLGFEDTLQPHLDKEFLKLRNKKQPSRRSKL